MRFLIFHPTHSAPNASLPAWPYGKTMSRIGFAFFLFALLSKAVHQLAAGALYQAAPEYYAQPWVQFLLSDLSLYGVGFPVLYLVLKPLPATQPAPEQTMPLSGRRFLQIVCIAFSGGYLLNFLTLALIALATFLKGRPIDFPLNDLVTHASIWETFLFVALLPAVMEEVLCRWMLFQKLRRFGEKPFLFTSAALFALLHGNLYQLLFTFWIGLLLAYLLLKTGSLFYSICLHFTLNFTSAVLAPLISSLPNGPAVLGLFLLAVIILGICYFQTGRKTLRLSAGQALPNHPFWAALCTPGLLCYTVLSVATIVFNLLI